MSAQDPVLGVQVEVGEGEDLIPDPGEPGAPTGGPGRFPAPGESAGLTRQKISKLRLQLPEKRRDLGIERK